MTKASENLFPGIVIRESANDGSDFSSPSADYRRLYLGEDGVLHVKDSSGFVTHPFARIGRSNTTFASDLLLNASTDLTVATAIQEGAILAFASGTGAAAAQDNSAAMTASHPGLAIFSTGTTTTGRITFGNQDSSSILLGAGKCRFGLVMKLTTLSDGTNTYTVRMGWGDVFAGESVDFVGFRYSHGVNGGEWQAVTRSNSTETATDTNVAADTNWHTYEADINAGATSVQFWIDGTSVGTNSTNVPTGTGREVTMIPLNLIKSAGTTARTVQLDAYWYIYEFTTAR